jgi:hypothetical protein
MVEAFDAVHPLLLIVLAGLIGGLVAVFYDLYIGTLSWR